MCRPAEIAARRGEQTGAGKAGDRASQHPQIAGAVGSDKARARIIEHAWASAASDRLDLVKHPAGDPHTHRQRREANNGDIVLARIGQEATLKRYQRLSKDTVEFQPVSTNPEHQPIHVDANTDDVAIVGVVVGAIIGTRRAAQ